MARKSKNISTPTIQTEKQTEQPKAHARQMFFSSVRVEVSPKIELIKKPPQEKMSVL